MKSFIIIFSFNLFFNIIIFSQENIVQGMDIFLENNNLRIRVDKKTIKENFFLRTTINLNNDGFELYEGILYFFNEDMNIELGYGFKQVYYTDVDYVFHTSYRGFFDNLDVRIDYSSNLKHKHCVSSSLIYYTKDNFGIGITSINNNFGLRFENKLNNLI